MCVCACVCVCVYRVCSVLCRLQRSQGAGIVTGPCWRPGRRSSLAELCAPVAVPGPSSFLSPKERCRSFRPPRAVRRRCRARASPRLKAERDPDSPWSAGGRWSRALGRDGTGKSVYLTDSIPVRLTLINHANILLITRQTVVGK